jgi:hypothetical protein
MNVRTLMIFDIHARKNTKRDERYYEIEMLDDETGTYVKTYTSESNFNYDNWEPVIDAWQPSTMIAIRGVFKFKRDSKTMQFTNIVNADSKPHIDGIYDQSVRDAYLDLYASKYL